LTPNALVWQVPWRFRRAARFISGSRRINYKTSGLLNFPLLVLVEFWRDRGDYPQQLFVGLDGDSVERGTNPQSAVYFIDPIFSEDMSSSWPYRILIIFYL